MAKEIILEPAEVWEYYQQNQEELEKSIHEIASRKDFGVVIYLTREDELPTIYVEMDGDFIYHEGAVNPTDCKRTVEKIYDDYLTENVINKMCDMMQDDHKNNGAPDNDDFTLFDLEAEMDDRERELDDAIYDLIDTYSDRGYHLNPYADDDMIQDVKDHIAEYLARKWGVPVYRPMWIEYDDGTESFEEYPYDHIIFEDENNPIYK